MNKEERILKYINTADELVFSGKRYYENEFYNGTAPKGIFASEYLKTSTLQNNGWIRVNMCHKDHTVEEYYDK